MSSFPATAWGHPNRHYAGAESVHDARRPGEQDGHWTEALEAASPGTCQSVEPAPPGRDCS